MSPRIYCADASAAHSSIFSLFVTFFLHHAHAMQRWCRSVRRRPSLPFNSFKICCDKPKAKKTNILMGKTGATRATEMLDTGYRWYPNQGSGIGLDPVNGHPKHKRRHGKHMSLAGAVSAKRNRRYEIPPRQQPQVAAGTTHTHTHIGWWEVVKSHFSSSP